MDWDSYIENEGTLPFVTLPEGDYEFTVTKFEKGEHPGSAKVPRCPKAMLELTVEVPNVGRSIVRENLFIDESVEWKLCEFFRCIGQKKHGTGIKMDWNKVKGAKGKAHLIVNEYAGQDGTQKTNNRVGRYLDPDAVEVDGGTLPW
jgi:hypothetical protein